MANELAERVAEWAASRYPESEAGLDYCRELVDTTPEEPADERLVALAKRAVALDEERDSLDIPRRVKMRTRSTTRRR